MYTTQGYFIEIEEYKNVSPLKEMPIIKSNEDDKLKDLTKEFDIILKQMEKNSIEVNNNNKLIQTAISKIRK